VFAPGAPGYEQAQCEREQPEVWDGRFGEQSHADSPEKGDREDGGEAQVCPNDDPTNPVAAYRLAEKQHDDDEAVDVSEDKQPHRLPDEPDAHRSPVRRGQRLSVEGGALVSTMNKPVRPTGGAGSHRYPANSGQNHPAPRSPYYRRVSRVGRLTVVLALNLVLVAGLVVAGLSAHSLGVLAAGVDYLADAASIGSLLAIWLSRRPPSLRRPDGYRHATNVAALVNGGWLLVFSVLVVVGAIRRLMAGAAAVHGLMVLIASAIATVVVMGIGALIRGGELDDDCGAEDFNTKAVLPTPFPTTPPPGALPSAARSSWRRVAGTGSTRSSR